jgi:ABC-type nitrate/sulfonate/bicarbonate transport system substrate-binding protein
MQGTLPPALQAAAAAAVLSVAVCASWQTGRAQARGEAPPPTTEAQAGDTLQVIVFGGGFNLPIWAAQEQGFFEDESVSVELTNTPGSAFQLQNLIDGNFDIAMTAADNVVAYQEGQGEAEHTEEGSFWLSMR